MNARRNVIALPIEAPEDTRSAQLEELRNVEALLAIMEDRITRDEERASDNEFAADRANKSLRLVQMAIDKLEPVIFALANA